jgi:hypothetical protein
LSRLHLFEWFALGNLLAVAVVGWWTLPLVGSLPGHLISFLVLFCLQAVAGIVIRGLICLLRGDRAYFRVIASREWIIDTFRLMLASSLIVIGYGWLKLIVPITNLRLFDQELWEIDRLLFLGNAPVLFLLHLFGDDAFLRVIDWSYANVFFTSTIVAFAWVFSEPSRRVRFAFANGNAVLWIGGAWLYFLIPSLGPAYAFPDIWFAHSETLRTTQSLQAVLMRNYQNVIRAAAGEPVTAPIHIAFGIGAFPSLHVAFQLYVFLWMRRLWTSGEVLFGLFAVTIFLGSMITGWHYLIDGIAGIAMAWICYRVPWRRSRLSRWLELRQQSGT